VTSEGIWNTIASEFVIVAGDETRLGEDILEMGTTAADTGESTVNAAVWSTLTMSCKLRSD